MAFFNSYFIFLQLLLLTNPAGISTQQTTIPTTSARGLTPSEEQDMFDEATKKDPLQYLFEVTRQKSQFKFILGAGAHDCYYQEIPPGHTLHSTASVFFDDAGPNAERIKYSVHYANNDTSIAQEESTPETSYEFMTDSEAGGTYSMCFENPRISAKLMWLTVVYYKTFNAIPTTEHAYLPGSKIAVANFMERINKLEEKILTAIYHLTHFRFAVGFDHRMQHGSQHFMTIWFFEKNDDHGRRKVVRPPDEAAPRGQFVM